MPTVLGLNIEGKAMFNRWFTLQAGLTLQQSHYDEAIAWNDGKRIRDAAFFLIIMLVTFAATLLNPQKYVSSRTIQKCVEHVSTST